MKTIMFFWLFVLASIQSFSQIQELVELLPKKFKENTVLYYYYPSNSYFAFHASSYLKIIEHDIARNSVNKNDCNETINKLKAIEKQRIIYLDDTCCDCFPSSIIFAKLFSRKSVLVLSNDGEMRYSIVKYSVRKNHGAIVVTERNSTNVIYSGTYSLKIKN